MVAALPSEITLLLKMSHQRESHVDLGFLTECEPWLLESYHFPSKVGGKPAWLDPKNIPSPERLTCNNCKKPMVFLCQVYAPFEEDEANFHRTLFIFICREEICCVRNVASNIKIFRCSLPRFNEFYSAQPAQEENVDFSFGKWNQLCSICGVLGDKKCGKCKSISYCGREHQVLDWREGHKNECGNQNTQRISKILFAESLLDIESEEYTQKLVDLNEEFEKLGELQEEGKAGTLNVSDTELERYATADHDKVFAKFKERIALDNEQVLRYEKGGIPLWIAADPKPTEIPNCEHCGCKRQFEFQIMPQLFTILHEYELDIGIIIVYTCEKSCTGGEKYKEEYVFKQDVSLNT